MAPTAAEKAQAEDQAKREHAAFVGGVEAGSSAVKRVADEAIEAARRSAPSGYHGDFVVAGSPGGGFTVRGRGFSTGGTVQLNGKQLETLEWGNDYIRGKLPSDAKAGEVVVSVDEKTQQRGYLRV